MLCQAEALLCPAEERELGFACVAVQAVQAESVDKLVNTRDLRTGDPTTRWPITRPSHVHRVGVYSISSYIYSISHLILLYVFHNPSQGAHHHLSTYLSILRGVGIMGGHPSQTTVPITIV